MNEDHNVTSTEAHQISKRQKSNKKDNSTKTQHRQGSNDKNNNQTDQHTDNYINADSTYANGRQITTDTRSRQFQVQSTQGDEGVAYDTDADKIHAMEEDHDQYQEEDQYSSTHGLQQWTECKQTKWEKT